MAVVSVSMPDELLENIDEFASEKGYTGRSEVIREAARNLLSEFENQALGGQDLVALVSALYDYQTASTESQMMELRHSHDSLVTSKTHSHVGETYCMEVFVLEGELEEVAEFVSGVRSIEKTLAVEYSIVSLNNIGTQIGDSLPSESDL